ncbi:MAG: tyrosine-type recombinase/integrase, partial [Thermomicrobiales bacterium]
SQDEYRRLLIAAGKMVAEASDQDRQLFEELNDLIVFMVASLIRPSEWSRLRLRDVEIVDGAEPHVRVHVHHGKVRGRHAVSLPSAIPVVRRIAERLKEDRNGYLFLNQYPNRVTARDKMRSLFERLVKFAELEFDGEGKRRTAYSLRHTAIMLRLLEGDNIDLIVLAGNAGTGIQQIQRFYGSHLLPEMKLDNLLSMKRRQSFDPRLGELGVISPASQKSKVLFVQTST